MIFSQKFTGGNNLVLTFLLIIILFIVFWVLIRPSQIKRDCYQTGMVPTHSIIDGKYQRDGGERFSEKAYEECLKKEGL